MEEAYGKVDGFLLNFGDYLLSNPKKRRPLIVRGAEWVYHLGAKSHPHIGNIDSKIKTLFEKEEYENFLELKVKAEKPEEIYDFQEILHSIYVEERVVLARYTKEFYDIQVKDISWQVRLTVAFNSSEYDYILRDDSDFRVLSTIALREKNHRYIYEKIRNYSKNNDINGAPPSFMHEWVLEKLIKSEFTHDYFRIKFYYSKRLLDLIDHESKK